MVFRVGIQRGPHNRLMRGWSGYFHYRHSSRVFGKLRWWVNGRMRRWLWRKHACRSGCVEALRGLQAKMSVWTLRINTFDSWVRLPKWPQFRSLV